MEAIIGSSDEVSSTSEAKNLAVKPCNIRLVLPSGQKFKESFSEGNATSLAVVLNRVVDRLSATACAAGEHVSAPTSSRRRFDLLYGYPPKRLSKRLADLAVSGNSESSGDISSNVLSSHLQLTVNDLCLNSETVTVLYL